MKKTIYLSILLSTMTLLALRLILAVSGTITRESGAAVPGIDVQLSGTTSTTTTTDASGFYQFAGLANGEDLTVTPQSGPNDCLSPCHNLYDLWLLRLHILGVQPLNSPYAIISGDLNNSQTLSAQDYIQLNQLLLGQLTSLQNNTCYRFVPDNYVFPSPSNPFSQAWPESANINNLGGDLQADFIAMLIGDISGCTDTPLAGDPVFTVNSNSVVPNGTNLNVPVEVAGFAGVQGFQFTVSWDPTVADFQGFGSFAGLNGFSTVDLGQTETGQGFLRAVWVSDSGPEYLANGTTLFEMNFDAVGTPGSTTPLALDGSRIEVLAIDSVGDLVAPQVIDGSLTIEGNAGGELIVTAGNEVTTVGSQVCVPITVENFVDVAGMQFPVVYSPVFLQYSHVQNFAFPSLTATNFNLFGAGELRLSWSDPGGVGQTLPDGSVLFEVCFDALQVGSSPIDLTSPNYSVEFSNSNFNLIPASTNFGEVIIEGVEEVCPGLDISISPVDSSGHACCWLLDYSNALGDTVRAIELEALDGIGLDYSLPAGYIDPDNDASSVLITPANLGVMPFNIPGLAEICLSNVFVSPQEVLVKYYDNNYELFCVDTLFFQCPIEPECLAILSDTISCDTAGYLYSLDVQNPPGGDFDIGLIKLTVTEPPGLAGTYPISFPTPLSPGDQTTLDFSLSTFNYFDGDTLCYILTAHNGPGEELCCFAQEGCIPLPDCDPCDDVMADLKILEDSCCYRLELSNNYPVVGYFDQLQTTILNPGVEFISVDYPLGTGWWQSPSGPTDQFTWSFDGDSIPIGVYDLFDFCVGGVTTTDSVCILVEWLNDEMTVCSDTLKLFCPDCIHITEDEISCDEATGEYTYTFSGQNLSDGYTVNAISILNSDPNYSIQPTTINFPDTPPDGFFGPLSYTITPTGAAPGDTICVDLVLRQIVGDSINIECCYLTHCIVLPPCESMNQACDCDDLDANALCGFTELVNCYDITLTPNCLLDNCDSVRWITGFGGFLGNTMGNEPITITVPGPGIYTYQYQVTRTDDDGNVCVSANLGQNVDVPVCNGGCPEINCIAPEDVVISCGELPPGFDPNEPNDLSTFGAATSDCPDYSWFENAPLVNLNDCSEGTITRSLFVDDGQGNQSQNACQQVITIVPGNNYSIGFTADQSGDCSILEGEGATISGSACDMLAITMVEEEAVEPVGGECIRLIRTYTVIDWCEYNGIDPAVVIDRDEDCDGDDGNLDVWVHVVAGATFIDADSDPNNFFPAEGTRGTACDGQSNPEGHWRSTATHPGLVSSGIWQYSQVLEVNSAPVNYLVPDVFPFCAEPFSCEGTVSMQVSVAEPCPLAPSSTNFFLDIGTNEVYEVGVEVQADGTVTDFSVVGFTVTVSGTYPDWTFEVPGIPLGDHNVRIFGQNACSVSGFTDIPISMTDCTPPQAICTSVLAAQLMDINPPTDIDGDGQPDLVGLVIPATDFDEGSFDDCGSYIVSINRVGEAPDPLQTEIGVTCDDLGTVNVEIWFWDENGNGNSCLSTIQVQDDNGLCPSPFGGDLGGIHLHPNPAADELLIRATRTGEAQISILSADRRTYLQRSTSLERTGNRQDISHLRPGLYWLRIQYADGTLLYQRFVKI